MSVVIVFHFQTSFLNGIEVRRRAKTDSYAPDRIRSILEIESQTGTAGKKSFKTTFNVAKTKITSIFQIESCISDNPLSNLALNLVSLHTLFINYTDLIRDVDEQAPIIEG